MRLSATICTFTALTAALAQTPPSSSAKQATSKQPAKQTAKAGATPSATKQAPTSGPSNKQTTTKQAATQGTSKQSSSKTVASKGTPAKGSTAQAGSKSGSGKAGGSKTANSKSKAGQKQAPRRLTQQAPTADRYKEIQQALADKGFFSGPVDGTWGPSSTDALKRFQSSQSLESDGKLGALSLIALGLGPKHAAVPPPAPAAE